MMSANEAKQAIYSHFGTSGAYIVQSSFENVDSTYACQIECAITGRLAWVSIEDHGRTAPVVEWI